MKLSHVVRKALPGLVTIALGTALALFYFIHDREEARERAIDAFVHADVKPRLQEKSRELRMVLGSIYQNLNLMAQMPALRTLGPGNRSSDTESAVEAGHISRSDHEVLRQIFHTLYDTVMVSEVYVVADGFDDLKGDIPLITFDDPLSISGQKPAGQDTSDADTPAEKESEEYAWLRQQLSKLKDSNAGPDDIPPFLVSPPMQTCDNSQYISIRDGQVRDAMGVVMGVPIRNQKGGLNGLVVAVVRTNALEAILTGAPKILVTREDRDEARLRNWITPQVSSLVLSGGGGLTVFDRRNPTAANQVKYGAAGQTVFNTEVSVPDGSHWTLSHLLSPADKAEVTRQSDAIYRLPLVATGLLALLMAAGVIFMARLRAGNEHLREVLTAARDTQNTLEQRNQDMSNIQKQLVNNEKMAALGVFTSGLTHEISNPAQFALVSVRNAETQLTDLRLFVQGLLHGDDDELVRTGFNARLSKIETSLGSTVSGLTRIERVIQTLHTTYPEADAGVRPADVIEALEAAWQLVLPSIRVPVRLRTNWQARPLIPCRIGDISQVFIAVLTNAGHAMEDACITRGTDFRGELHMESHLLGDTLEIIINDNGNGVPEVIRERIFDPFFTTKPVGRGSGLGLSLARDLMAHQGGSIALGTPHGHGAAFVLRMPLTPR